MHAFKGNPYRQRPKLAAARTNHGDGQTKGGKRKEKTNGPDERLPGLVSFFALRDALCLSLASPLVARTVARCRFHLSRPSFFSFVHMRPSESVCERLAHFVFSCFVDFF